MKQKALLDVVRDNNGIKMSRVAAIGLQNFMLSASQWVVERHRNHKDKIPDVESVRDEAWEALRCISEVILRDSKNEKKILKRKFHSELEELYNPLSLAYNIDNNQGFNLSHINELSKMERCWNASKAEGFFKHTIIASKHRIQETQRCMEQLAVTKCGEWMSSDNIASGIELFFLRLILYVTYTVLVF